MYAALYEPLIQRLIENHHAHYDCLLSKQGYAKIHEQNDPNHS